nr:outer membrane lipoprotein carrier protein LolA [Shimia abyssi]
MIKKLFLVPAFLAVSTMPAMAEKLSLDALSTYLNGMTTVKSAFTQISDDGTVQTGNLYIKRPGKMRFEYNPPETSVVLASNNAVAIFDGRSNQPPETYPLRRTPLSIILARNVNLKQANMVVGHEYDGTATIVTAQDPVHPEHGYIQLKFTDSPAELRQWVIFDGGGGQTTVILGETEKELELPNSLFSIERMIGRDN